MNEFFLHVYIRLDGCNEISWNVASSRRSWYSWGIDCEEFSVNSDTSRLGYKRGVIDWSRRKWWLKIRSLGNFENFSSNYSKFLNIFFIQKLGITEILKLENMAIDCIRASWEHQVEQWKNFQVITLLQLPIKVENHWDRILEPESTIVDRGPGCWSSYENFLNSSVEPLKTCTLLLEGNIQKLRTTWILKLEIMFIDCIPKSWLDKGKFFWSSFVPLYVPNSHLGNTVLKLGIVWILEIANMIINRISQSGEHSMERYHVLSIWEQKILISTEIFKIWEPFES